MEKKNLPKIFLMVLLIFVLYLAYRVFEPFLIELLMAAILSSIFYKPYKWLVEKMGGRRALASLLMCIFVVLIIIVPVTNLIVYGAQKSVETYTATMNFFEHKNPEEFLRSEILAKVEFLGLNPEAIKGIVLESTKKISTWFTSGATTVVKGTTSFVISLFLIIFTMFFFFKDGPNMLKKLMEWTPLPNRYDQEIFKKFRNVSYSTMISTFVVAIVEGILGGIAFFIVGLPVFIPAVFMTFCSLLPYVGTAIIWAPAAVYLFIIGEIWQAVFLVLWGAVVIGYSDNIIRAYMIKGKSQVHPIFIIFSILGGIALFGFWGIIFGPLIISIAVTILHIYELEYESVLEK